MRLQAQTSKPISGLDGLQKIPALHFLRLIPNHRHQYLPDALSVKIPKCIVFLLSPEQGKFELQIRKPHVIYPE